MSLAEQISKWIKEKAQKAGAEGVVIGLSGGLDSSLVACLAKRALGDKVLGLLMPCHSRALDEDYAQMVARKLKIRVKKIILDPLYDKFLEILPLANRIARANLKARLRMITLYYFANNLNYLVVGTGNKSEILTGYFTKYGDGGVDILPLGDLLKTEVRKLARQLEIPEEIIKMVPSAGLWEGQTDEGEIGLSYEDLDRIILAIESGKADSLSREKFIKVKRLMETSRHKRSPAPVFRGEK